MKGWEPRASVDAPLDDGRLHRHSVEGAAGSGDVAVAAGVGCGDGCRNRSWERHRRRNHRN